MMIIGIKKESKWKRRCVFCMVCVWYDGVFKGFDLLELGVLYCNIVYSI